MSNAPGGAIKLTSLNSRSPVPLVQLRYRQVFLVVHVSSRHIVSFTSENNRGRLFLTRVSGSDMNSALIMPCTPCSCTVPCQIDMHDVDTHRGKGISASWMCAGQQNTLHLRSRRRVFGLGQAVRDLLRYHTACRCVSVLRDTVVNNSPMDIPTR